LRISNPLRKEEARMELYLKTNLLLSAVYEKVGKGNKIPSVKGKESSWSRRQQKRKLLKNS